MDLVSQLRDRHLFLVSESETLTHARALRKILPDARICCSFYGTEAPTEKLAALGAECYDNVDVNLLGFHGLPFFRGRRSDSIPWTVWFQAPSAFDGFWTAPLVRKFVYQLEGRLEPGDRVWIGYAQNWEMSPYTADTYGIEGLIRALRVNDRWNIEFGGALVDELEGLGYLHRTNAGVALFGVKKPQWELLMLTKK